MMRQRRGGPPIIRLQRRNPASQNNNNAPTTNAVNHCKPNIHPNLSFNLGTMSTSTGTGWAQLRQQARSLETQVILYTSQ